MDYIIILSLIFLASIILKRQTEIIKRLDSKKGGNKSAKAKDKTPEKIENKLIPTRLIKYDHFYTIIHLKKRKNKSIPAYDRRVPAIIHYGENKIIAQYNLDGRPVHAKSTYSTIDAFPTGRRFVRAKRSNKITQYTVVNFDEIISLKDFHQKKK